MAVLRSGGVRRFYDVNGWLFVGPALALIAAFMVYPIAFSFWMSFQTGKGMNLSFGGFDNIVRLWHGTIPSSPRPCPTP